MTQEQLDLVERYLDGKASYAEASRLLNAMKEDPLLASDFEAMSTLHTAVDEDLATITLPNYLYGSIVEEATSAGILGAASGGAATSWLSSAGYSILLLFIALTMIVAFGVWTATTTPIPEPVVRSEVAHPVPSPDVPQPHPDLVSGFDRSLLTTLVAAASAFDDPIDELLTPAVSAVEHDRPRPVAHVEATRRVNLLPVGIDQETHSEDMIAIRKMAYAVAPELMIAACADYASHDRGEHPTMSRPITSYTESSPLPPITIRILQRPLLGFSYDAQATESPLSSLALEADVHIGLEHRVGVGLHRDLFPMQIDNGDGTTTAAPYMTWVGAHYRWIPQMDLPLGAQPFLHVGAGGSSRGITLQPALGLMIPVSTLRLGIGADIIGLAFQNQNAWNTAFSPALRIELGFSW